MFVTLIIYAMHKISPIIYLRSVNVLFDVLKYSFSIFFYYLQELKKKNDTVETWRRRLLN